ncbi:hydrogenase maturation nickel metallochaperone HypA [Robertkochia sediminum]|uniref:hydrogenase maturation nickel metallochaperone HypA n=1 Tax=Robertkochia sediminum TaxID=2785326 RepID=UPI001932137E|nr:hydrogenase maturation nickel metallochaperone HypA [Robertkochia sediminum]MBL7472318.1 hydrogenase maturation nickel metallochaperone HypA [Robertkochia sediminum]
MHELSVAMGIVRIAKNELDKAKASRITRIELEIGELAGIEFEALDFVWPMAVKDTVLEHAERHIQRVNGKAKCLECDNEFTINQVYEPCPSCKSYLKGIVEGKELRVQALEVE